MPVGSGWPAATCRLTDAVGRRAEPIGCQRGRSVQGGQDGGHNATLADDSFCQAASRRRDHPPLSPTALIERTAEESSASQSAAHSGPVIAETKTNVGNTNFQPMRSTCLPLLAESSLSGRIEVRDILRQRRP